MPDGEGGNNDEGAKGTDEKVLDSPEVKAAIEAARKEGSSDGYKKGQSDQNKSTQTILDRAKTAEERVTELEKSHFDSLSPEDQQKRMVETLYRERNSGKGKASEQQDGPDSNEDTDADGDKAKKKARANLEEAVKAEGLDPADVDMDNGSAKFISSLLKARDAKKSEGKKGEDNTEGDKTDPNGGPVDKGGGSPSKKDITKVDTNEMFRNAYKKK